MTQQNGLALALAEMSGVEVAPVLNSAQTLAESKVQEIITLSQSLAKAWVAERVGVWVWVSNTQRGDQSHLKTLGFKWSGKKMAWYWVNEMRTGRYISAPNLDALRELHATETIWGRR